MKLDTTGRNCDSPYERDVDWNNVGVVPLHTMPAQLAAPAK